MRLRAWDLAIERGGRQLFSRLSFEAMEGSALIVTGPNGAGKSSLLRALCGFLPIEAGGFALDGADPERTLGEQAHYVGHQDALKAALTAGENLAFWASMLGGEPTRVAQAIDFPVSALSAGQKRRVALARLLIAHRPLWLLDEPTTSLDARAERAFAAIMQEHLNSGGMIVVATHAPLRLEGARELKLGAAA
jgi:heme exporter protein A